MALRRAAVSAPAAVAGSVYASADIRTFCKQRAGINSSSGGRLWRTGAVSALSGQHTTPAYDAFVSMPEPQPFQPARLPFVFLLRHTWRERLRALRWLWTLLAAVGLSTILVCCFSPLPMSLQRAFSLCHLRLYLYFLLLPIVWLPAHLMVVGAF